MPKPETVHLLLIENNEEKRWVARTILEAASVHCDISVAGELDTAKKWIDNHAQQSDEYPHAMVIDGNLEKNSKHGENAREILDYAEGKLDAFTIGLSSLRLHAYGIPVDVDLTKARFDELDRVIDEHFDV